MRNISDKSLTETQNAHFTRNNDLENRDVYKKTRKKQQSRAGHRQQYGECALHAGYLRLQISLRGLSPRANYTDRAAAAGRLN